MRAYHYLVDGAVLRIVGHRPPKARAGGRLIVIQAELLTDGSWRQPCFPEIVPCRLLRGEFLGSVPWPRRHTHQDGQ